MAADAADEDEPDQLVLALAEVGSAVRILDGFNHRNKNQHRTSRWWAQFDMLRRHARKLGRDLRGAAGSGGKPTTRSRRNKKVGLKESRNGYVDDAAWTVRAKWLRDEGVPRSYLAFTQLAADNQHAALGLLLLGVLAQVNAGLSRVLGDREAAISPPPRATSATENHHAASKVVVAAAAAAAEEDVGVAISREDAEQELRFRDDGRGSQGQSGLESKRPASPSKGPPKAKRKKGRRKKGDEFDDLFSSLV